MKSSNGLYYLVYMAIKLYIEYKNNLQTTIKSKIINL